MLEFFWLLGALLAALAAGVAFSHVLEIPGKRRLPPQIAIIVQQNLYAGYRAPGAGIEIGAIVAALVSTILAIGEGAAFWLTAAAFAAFVATMLIFFAVTDVNNRRIAQWNPDGPPDDWHRTRTRWEASHAARAALFLLGLGLLVGATFTR